MSISEWDKLKLNDKFHIDAQPSFDILEGKQMVRANRALTDLGNFIKDECEIPALRELEYAGSVSIHVFAGRTGAIFISQTSPLRSVSEWLAEKMLQRLKADMKVHYGHKRVKGTRSGV